MSYSTESARLLTTQLQKFVTYNRHQLAGQAANLDFWMAEVRHSLMVIDGFNQRFKALRYAQNSYVAAHDTVEFNLHNRRHTESSPALPRHVPHRELSDARQALCDAAKSFLRRCLKEGMIDHSRFDEAHQSFELRQ